MTQYEDSWPTDDTKRGADHAANHLANGLLLRAIDRELPEAEVAMVNRHLVQCEECSGRYTELLRLSDRLEATVNAIALPYSAAGRESLEERLGRFTAKTDSPAPSRVLWQFGWGMAAAAALALGVFFAPQYLDKAKEHRVAYAEPASPDTIRIDGETFVSLPYSNPDLPASASHIVQMQVPVLSLADAGVVFEPVTQQISAPDRTVLADVLVGLDGQPLGVHVLTSE